MKKVLLVLLILVMGTLSFAKGKTRKSGGHKAKACTSDKIIYDVNKERVTYCKNGKK